MVGEPLGDVHPGEVGMAVERVGKPFFEGLLPDVRPVPAFGSSWHWQAWASALPGRGDWQAQAWPLDEGLAGTVTLVDVPP